jgi:hypothetical protein
MMRIGFDAKRAFANKTGLGNYSRFVLDALMAHEPAMNTLPTPPKTTAISSTDFLPDQYIIPKVLLTKSFPRTGAMPALRGSSVTKISKCTTA